MYICNYMYVCVCIYVGMYVCRCICAYNRCLITEAVITKLGCKTFFKDKNYLGLLSHST